MAWFSVSTQAVAQWQVRYGWGGSRGHRAALLHKSSAEMFRMQRPLGNLRWEEILWHSRICSFIFTHKDGVNYGSSFFKMHQTILGQQHFVIGNFNMESKWNWHYMGLMLATLSKEVVSCRTTHGFDLIETVEPVLIVCPGSRWCRDVSPPTSRFWWIENCLLMSCSHNPTSSVP